MARLRSCTEWPTPSHHPQHEPRGGKPICLHIGTNGKDVKTMLHVLTWCSNGGLTIFLNGRGSPYCNLPQHKKYKTKGSMKKMCLLQPHNRLCWNAKLHHRSTSMRPLRTRISRRDVVRGTTTCCTVSLKTWCLCTLKFGSRPTGNSTKRTTPSSSASFSTLKLMRGTTTSSTD